MIAHLNDSYHFSRDLKSARIAAESDDFNFDQATVHFGDIKIDDSERITIQGQPFEITQDGIIKLCQTMRIPNPFANRIPNDLFVYNVNRLAREREKEPVDLFFNKRENIVDVNTKLDYYAVPITEMMDTIEKLNMNFDKFRVMFSGVAAKFEFISTDLSVKGELAPGICFQHYPTRHYHPFGNLAIWTLVCTNGAVMDLKGFPEEKLRLHSNKNLDITISKFFDRLLGSATNLDMIAEKYFNMKKQELPLELALKYFKKLKSLFGTEEAYSALGDKVSYQLQRFLNGDSPEGEEIGKLLDGSLYDVYYAITDYASNGILGDVGLSRKLQVMSGSLLAGVPDESDAQPE